MKRTEADTKDIICVWHEHIRIHLRMLAWLHSMVTMQQNKSQARAARTAKDAPLRSSSAVGKRFKWFIVKESCKHLGVWRTFVACSMLGVTKRRKSGKGGIRCLRIRF